MAKRQTATRSTPKDVDVIGEALGASEDELMASQDGIAIRSWLQGIAGFFTTAKAIEAAALETRAAAVRLLPPTTADEDAAIQTFARKATADCKAAEEHWTVALLASRFHRRLVAARTRATQPLTEAREMATNHHNRYVEQERRRVAQEQERLRLEAERRAREDRERDLQQLEQQRLEAEAAAPDLSEREEAFVDAMTSAVSGWRGDATRCAQMAGFKEPVKAGARLLNMPKIQQAIQARRDALAARDQAAALRDQPLDIGPVEEVKPNVQKGSGYDRTSWTGEILDGQATLEAFRSGKFGIPADLFEVNQTKLNEYARSLQTRLDLWPGVRAKKKTSIV